MSAKNMPNPSTVLGRQLGQELRQLRQSAGVTMAHAATALDCTSGQGQSHRERPRCRQAAGPHGFTADIQGH